MWLRGTRRSHLPVPSVCSHPPPAPRPRPQLHRPRELTVRAASPPARGPWQRIPSRGAVGFAERGAGAQGPREPPGGRGSCDPGLSEPPDGDPGGNSSHCLGNSYRQRQTALFTDICQPSPRPDLGFPREAKAGVGRWGHTGGGRLCLHAAAQGASSHGIMCLRAQVAAGPRAAPRPPAHLPRPRPCPALLPPPLLSFLLQTLLRRRRRRGPQVAQARGHVTGQHGGRGSPARLP